MFIIQALFIYHWGFKMIRIVNTRNGRIDFKFIFEKRIEKVALYKGINDVEDVLYKAIKDLPLFKHLLASKVINILDEKILKKKSLQFWIR